MELETSYTISQGLFLKLLGLNYLCAFISLLMQIKGLYGSGGIAPFNDLLRLVRQAYGKKSFRSIPTLFWINASNPMLFTMVWIGIIASMLCVLGFFPAPILAVMWVIYFSFYNIGSPFLNYQWDVLLLEVGSLGILFAVQSPPPILIVYLLWFLLFRFMFSSGYMKLIWGSIEWRDLTAMKYHYETQPLPTRLAYYAHQRPLWLSKASVLGVYFFELIVPLFIFSPEIIQALVCVLLIAFQLLIIATGNYAFFNTLSITMCIPLLPDRFLTHFESFARFSPIFGENAFVSLTFSIIAMVLFFANVLEFAALFAQSRIIQKILSPFHDFCCAAPYGLFVRMTTYRDEIIIEGSQDMQIWKAYEFKWKPGDLYHAPGFVAPHQPRLDWQMWFASLSDYQHVPWFQNFLFCLLEGSEDVLDLLKVNPFPDNPPKYIRASLYRYHFTDSSSKQKTGRWWNRSYIGQYSPVLSSCDIS
ncbi:MAG TPA: lipase maturation factor family protein [Waddliaceae bacterium]